MLIAQLMSRTPVTVRPTTPLAEAMRLFSESHIHHLPVTTPQGDLIGIITDRDIRRATRLPLLPVDDPTVSTPLSEVTVGTVMTAAPLTTTPGTTLLEAAQVMRSRQISCLPVVQGHQLVGIVTKTDLFDCFVGLMEQRGARLFWDF